MMRRLWAGALVGAAVLLGPAAAQSAAAVPQLDLNKFAGTWYEVAMLPNKAEKKCVGDTLRLYDVSDKVRRFQSVASCRVKQGYPNVRNEDGRVHNKNGDGTLEVSRLVFLHRKTWVLALGPDYGWALVGSPNHKQLWLLSRKPHPAPEEVAEMKSRAAAQGFDVGKLVSLPQSSR